MKSTAGHLSLTLLLGLAAATAWWAWMAWDHTYQRDPMTGEWHGPYQTWQVLGCAATLIVAALVGATLSHPLTISLMPIAFTVAWSWTAAPGDDTGLWLVGAFLVLLGTTFGAVVVGVIATILRSRGKRHDGALR